MPGPLMPANPVIPGPPPPPPGGSTVTVGGTPIGGTGTGTTGGTGTRSLATQGGFQYVDELIADFVRRHPERAGQRINVFDPDVMQEYGLGFDQATGAWNGPIPREFANTRRGDGFTGIRPGSGVFVINGQDAAGSQYLGGTLDPTREGWLDAIGTGGSIRSALGTIGFGAGGPDGFTPGGPIPAPFTGDGGDPNAPGATRPTPPPGTPPPAGTGVRPPEFGGPAAAPEMPGPGSPSPAPGGSLGGGRPYSGAIPQAGSSGLSGGGGGGGSLQAQTPGLQQSNSVQTFARGGRVIPPRARPAAPMALAANGDVSPATVVKPKRGKKKAALPMKTQNVRGNSTGHMFGESGGYERNPARNAVEHFDGGGRVETPAAPTRVPRRGLSYQTYIATYNRNNNLDDGGNTTPPLSEEQWNALTPQQQSDQMGSTAGAPQADEGTLNAFYAAVGRDRRYDPNRGLILIRPEQNGRQNFNDPSRVWTDPDTGLIWTDAENVTPDFQNRDRGFFGERPWLVGLALVGGAGLINNALMAAEGAGGMSTAAGQEAARATLLQGGADPALIQGLTPSQLAELATLTPEQYAAALGMTPEEYAAWAATGGPLQAGPGLEPGGGPPGGGPPVPEGVPTPGGGPPGGLDLSNFTLDPSIQSLNLTPEELAQLSRDIGSTWEGLEPVARQTFLERLMTDPLQAIKDLGGPVAEFLVKHPSAVAALVGAFSKPSGGSPTTQPGGPGSSQQENLDLINQITREQYDRYRNRYIPVEDKYIDETMALGGEGDQLKKRERAIGDVASEYSAMRGATKRGLERYGLGSRFAAQSSGFNIAEGAARAGAANMAGDAAEREGRLARERLAGRAMNIPGSLVSGASTAANLGRNIDNDADARERERRRREEEDDRGRANLITAGLDFVGKYILNRGGRIPAIPMSRGGRVKGYADGGEILPPGAPPAAAPPQPGMPTDTVNAKLAPGEAVINPEGVQIVDQIDPDLIDRINAVGLKIRAMKGGIPAPQMGGQ